MKISKLFEVTTRKYDFNEDTQEMLWYLIHSKDHVWMRDYKEPMMQAIMDTHTVKVIKSLYRGFKNKDHIQMLISGESVDAFTSFSENRKTAEKFGEVITLNSPCSGFCYWDWIVSELDIMKTENQEEYNSIDGDFLQKTARDESEWILPFDMKLKVIDAEKLIFEQL